MTSQAKIDANRRNALKSTGPRSKTGKASSARNATKHGLTIAPNAKDVLVLYRGLMEDGNAEPEWALHEERAFLALQLAKTEVHVENARQKEANLLKNYDFYYKHDVDEEAYIQDIMSGKAYEFKLSRREATTLLRTVGFGRQFGPMEAKRQFRLMHRYIREAEAQNASARRAFCESGSLNPETKPKSVDRITETKPN